VPLAGPARRALPAAAPAALAGARPVPYWLDQPGRPAPEPPLNRATAAGLAVIGGGFTGLWTALLAKERDPATDVVLLEGRSIGWAASGRNGGFCAASLTHGLGNGRARFPAEIAELDRLGMTNLDEIAGAIARYGIDCAAERTGELVVAVAPWQLAGLRADASIARADRSDGRRDLWLRPLDRLGLGYDS
jgi:glycine/D-amino acid oxidase-like deaminating enzyme